MPSDLDIMERHVQALFTHDDGGRLCLVNEPDGAEAPRFFLGRTAEGNIRRFRFDLPQNFVEQLEALCLEEPATGDLRQEPAHFSEYLRLFETHSPVQKISMGPAYIFPDKIKRQPRKAVIVTSENLDVLSAGLEEWIPDVPYRRPFLAILHEGRAVSVCCSVRITSESHEAGVETLEAFRGNGLAADVTVQWANEVRKMGAMPLYSTSWENAASQSVAKKMGLVQYGTDFHVM